MRSPCGAREIPDTGRTAFSATITSITVPDGALDGTGTYETAAPSEPGEPGSVDTGSVDTGSVDTGSVDTAAPTAEPTTGGAG